MKTRLRVTIDVDHDPMDFHHLSREVREVIEGAFPDRGPAILDRCVDISAAEYQPARASLSSLDGWPYLPPSKWSDEQREHVQKCILGHGVCALCQANERTMP